MLLRFTVLLLAVLLSTPVLSRAESRLIFPRLVFQQARFSGVAIANPNPVPAAITLTAYNGDGSLFSGTGVTNPRVVTIEAGSQYAKLATEILNPPASVAEAAAAISVWMEVTSPVDGLTGFFLDGDFAIDFLDGSDLSGTGADLILPFVMNSGQTTTELTLINPDGAGPANVVADLATAEGALASSQSLTLPTRGALQGSLGALFPGASDLVRTIRLRSDRPIACVAFVTRQPENSLITVAARKANAPSRTIYFPQLAQGGDWATSVGIVNLAASQILVTLTAYKPDGTLFGPPVVADNPVSRTVKAGGLLSESAASLFGFDDPALQGGWVKAEAGEAAITGYVEYGAGSNRALVMAPTQAVTRAIFSHQANGSPYYTGLALLNPGSLAANVEVVSLSTSSQPLGLTRRILKPGQREAVLIDQWISGAANAVGGSIFVKSDVEVIATQLFGTTSFSALSNVPPQDVPAAYDPASGAPGLAVLPPLAVVETGKSLQFTATGLPVESWGVSGGTPSASISPSGLFTAPSLAPSQHTQVVQASTAGGSQSSAASVDVVQREVLTSGLTLLTAVAYFESSSRFFVAEQQLLASEPGSRVRAPAAGTRISEVSAGGAATPFFPLPGDTVSKMLPFTDGSGAPHLLLAGLDTGSIYRLTLSNKALATVVTGLHQPYSMAIDPVSGNLFVSEAGAGQVILIERSRFAAGLGEPPEPGTQPTARLIPVASPRGIAFDPCTGALYVASADGALREYHESRVRDVVSGLEDPGQILILQRQGMPSCYTAVTVFAAESRRVSQIDPRAGRIVSFLEPAQRVRDLVFFDGGHMFSQNREASIVLADGPEGAGQSQVLAVPVGGLYEDLPEDSGLGSGLEFLPAADSIAFRDRIGDTFATSRTSQAGLATPDIVSVSVYRIGSDNTVTVGFTGPVAPASSGAAGSVAGWIDLDSRRGSGIASHAAEYRPLRPDSSETDAYVDLSNAVLYRVTSPGSPPAETPVRVHYLDNSINVVFPVALVDALNSRINVTVRNRVETTDVAPESGYAFASALPATGSVQFAAGSSRGPESTRTVPLTVVLSPAATETVTVQYRAGEGSSAGAGDFMLNPGTLTFAPGQTTRTINLAVTDDSIDEEDESVVVVLTSGAGAALGRANRHIYTVVDNDNPPAVQFRSASSSGPESASASLSVALASSSGRTVTVQYAVSGGTATGGGTDYTLAAGVLSFAPGETAKAISLPVVNDSIDERDETVVVALSNPVNATLGAQTSHTYTIVDDDSATPVVQFSQAASSGQESATRVSLPVTLSSAAAQTVTVQYSVTGGTATGGGQDYVLAAGTLTIPQGQPSASITLTVVDDISDEPEETVVVGLSNPQGATLGSTASHIYTIVDNDNPALPAVQFSQAASSGPESATQAALSVTLSPAANQTVTVQYSVTGGTASGRGVDYTLAAGTLTIGQGQTAASIPLSVVDDAIDEADETVIVTLSNPTGANIGSNVSHTYAILDNDNPPVVQFGNAPGRNPESITPVNLPITLSQASGRTVTVSTSVSGSATSGTDFTLPGSLSFAPGETSKNLVLTVVNDTASEPDENVLVSLVNPVNATLGTASSHNYVILNDDTSIPSVQFSIASDEAGESAGQVPLQVRLSSATTTPVTVNYAVTGGTATGGPTGAGVDYILPSGTLTIPANSTVGTITLGVVNDTIGEFNETVEITLSNPLNATLGAISRLIFTIVDNDPRADLTVSAFSVRDPQLSPGERVVISNWYITNSGQGSAGTFFNGFYLSRDAVITLRDTRIGEDTQTLSLPAGQNVPGTTSILTIPSGTSSGTYYVGILVDRANDVPETSETNNYRSVPVTVGRISNPQEVPLEPLGPGSRLSIPDGPTTPPSAGKYYVSIFVDRRNGIMELERKELKSTTLIVR